MKAIVLTYDKYHPLTDHMICCYNKVWPDHPFIFSVPYQNYPHKLKKKHGNQIRLIPSESSIKKTVLNLLEDVGDDEWVYWCIDDKYPIKIDIPKVEKIYHWISSQTEYDIAGIALSVRQNMLKSRRIDKNEYILIPEINIKIYRRFNFVENHAQVFGINVLRNNGFLYEPGMFACVLIPALAFNTIINNEFYNNKNTVFIIAIITTFSTAAYLALAAYLIIYYVVCNGLTFLKTVIAVFVAAILGITIWQLEFIGEKIESQFDSALYGDYSQRHFGRIGSALVDIEEIREFPLIGRGRNQETRFDRSELLYNPHFAHRTNGLFDLMAAMGIPFFILYMFLLYRSINNFCLAQEWSKYAWMLFFIPFLIMASSQTILFRPLFLAFLFIYPNQLND